MKTKITIILNPAVFFLCIGFMHNLAGQDLRSVAVESETSEESSSVESGNESQGKIKIQRKRSTLRKSRIQELEAYHKKQKGTDIFGLGLIGFHGSAGFGSLSGLTQAGAPSNDFSGLGAGILADIQMASGSTNSIGVKTSGGWLWRWGLRSHLDFYRSSTKNKSLERVQNELSFSMIGKYYFPMDEIEFTRNIQVLNRFHWFIGLGGLWSVGINDTIEDLNSRTFKSGPNQSDFYFYMEGGFAARMTDVTYFIFDFGLGLNMTSEINDNLTGKKISGSGEGGHIMKMHAGFAFSF